MLISTARVTGIAWGITTNGSGVSFLTPASNLNDGRPGSVCRFVWPAHGSPAAAWVQFEGVWTAPSSARVVGLINISMPQGSVIEVSLRRAGSSVFDSPIGTVYVERLALGSRACWATLPDLGNVYTGVRLRFLAVGALGLGMLAGSVVDIGEVFIGDLEDVSIDRNWSVVVEDPLVSAESVDLQPFRNRGAVRRVLTFTPSRLDFGVDAVYGVRQGLGTDVDYGALESVYSRLVNGAQIACFPRYDATDFALLTRSAIFGAVTKVGGYRHLGGNRFGAEPITVKEAPVPR